MLPFPMFRPRQSRPHPQLPSASIQYVSVPATCARHLPRSARHSSTCDLASILPPVTSHASPITNSFRIRTSEKPAPNPFRIRTSKTQHLKPFRRNPSEKTGAGDRASRVPPPAVRLVRRAAEVQCSFWLWKGLAQLQLRTHEIQKDNYEDGHHQHFGNDSVSMTQSAKRNKGQPETHQPTNQTRILPLDPCRAMGASQPSPGIRIQKKRGCHIVLASRALCHGAHPFRCLV